MLKRIRIDSCKLSILYVIMMIKKNEVWGVSMKKKIGIGIGISLCLLIALGIITYCMDKYRVTIGCEPKYCIKIVNQGGNQVTYWGLGYKVIRDRKSVV